MSASQNLQVGAQDESLILILVLVQYRVLFSNMAQNIIHPIELPPAPLAFHVRPNKRFVYLRGLSHHAQVLLAVFLDVRLRSGVYQGELDIGELRNVRTGARSQEPVIYVVLVD